MKRTFISIGTSASSGVLKLIGKLREENIFGSYNDQYIAIDSDTSASSSFGKLKTLAKTVGRVRAIQLQYTHEDKTIAPLFQPDWTWPQIPANGVGGDRSKSEKARNWRAELRRLVFGSIAADDVIVVVGTAFGGTATGLYWAISEFLADELSRKIEKSPGGFFERVALIGFVMLPQPITNIKYPIASNVCDFFRELQLTHWRRRLSQLSATAGNGVFKVPCYVHDDPDLAGRLPLYGGAGARQNQGVGDSYLPMTTLYLMPSPEGGEGGQSTAQILLAEQLFAVFYLGVQREFHAMAVDRHSNGVEGSFLTEDPSFGGLNMVVYKSGRSLSIKKWFDREIVDACSVFGKDVTAGDAIKRNLVAIFKRHVYQNGTVGGEGENLRALRDAKATVLSDGRFTVFLGNLTTLAADAQREANGFVPSGRDFKALMNAILLDEGARRGWISKINAHTLREAYQEFAADHARGVSSADDALNRMVADARIADAKLKARLCSLPVRALGKREAVKKEILNGFSTAFDSALDALVNGARCKKTPITPPAEFDRDLQAFVGRVSSLAHTLGAGGAVQTGEPYIIEGIATGDWRLPSDWGWNAEPFMATALAAALDGNIAFRDGYIEDRRDDSVEELNRLLQNPAHPDPFANAAVNLSFKKAKTFSHAFKLASIDDPNGSPHSSHFCISPSGSVPSDDADFTCCFVQDAAKLDIGLTFMDLPLGERFFKNGSAVHHLAKGEYAEARMLQQGRRADDDVRIQGIWLGTERADFTLQEVLKNVFPLPNTKETLMANAHKVTEGVVVPRRLYTLKEMVCVGTLLQALEVRANAAWRGGLADGKRLSLLADRGGSRREFASIGLTASGFVTTANGSGLRLLSIDAVWFSAFLAWINEKTGPSAFKQVFGPELAPLNQLDVLERNILTQGSLCITQDTKYAIDALHVAIAGSLQVTIQ